MMINCDLLFSQFRKCKRGMRFVVCFSYFFDRNCNRKMFEYFGHKLYVEVFN